MTTVRIERRYRGPPESGNGGYVAGLVAATLGGSNCTVRLMAPPPVGEDLTLTAEATTASLMKGDEVIVSAASRPVDIDVPPPPSLEEARDAEPRFAGLTAHIFPGCFVCGPDRETGDGMRIFPGTLNDPAEQVAATWTPDASLADDNGLIRPEFVWAALDCPGYFALGETAGFALLGQMSATLHRSVTPDQTLIVTGWPIDSEGRKHRVGSAVHNSDGELLAAAEGVWISVRSDPKEDSD